MMTQNCCHTNNCPPDHVVYSCLHEGNIPSLPPSNRIGPACAAMPERKSTEHDAQHKAGAYPSAAEMPLWLSPGEIRSAMGKNFSRENELKQALKCRSVIICAAMISMIALGLIMTV